MGTYETLIYNLSHPCIIPSLKKDNKFQLKQIDNDLWQKLIPFLAKEKI